VFSSALSWVWKTTRLESGLMKKLPLLASQPSDSGPFSLTGVPPAMGTP